MSPASAGTAKVIVCTHSGKEAETILAQSRGYREIAWLMLTGLADRDAEEFVRRVRQITFQRSQEGA